LGHLWEATLRLGVTFKTNSYCALIPSTDSFVLHCHGLTEPTAFLAPTLALTKSCNASLAAVAAVSSYHRLCTRSGNARKAPIVDSSASRPAAPLGPVTELGCTTAREKGQRRSQCLPSPPHS